MVGIVTRTGRPCKHQGGWDINARIYLSMETLVLWRRLQSEREFTSDNEVAVFLLEHNKTLTELQTAQKTGKHGDTGLLLISSSQHVSTNPSAILESYTYMRTYVMNIKFYPLQYVYIT